MQEREHEQLWIQNCRQQAPRTGVALGAPDIRTEIVHGFLKDKDALQLLHGEGGVLREHLSTPFAIFALSIAYTEVLISLQQNIHNI